MRAEPVNLALRRLARRAGVGGGARAVARRLGYDLLHREYYSPVPDVEALPPSTWTSERELHGIDLDVPRSLRFLESELGPFLAEFAPPAAPTGRPGDVHLDNGFYGRVDAEVLYAMVRHARPARVLELGSGISTLVIAEALRRDGADPSAEHVVYDPYPRADLVGRLDAVADLRRVSAADVPAEEIAALRASDILFVDTSHTVKIGGEVLRIVLDLLPRLAPGVVVHVHDIYLPWEYPREFVAERRFFWAEQYLLQAFLAYNPAFEVVLPVHAVYRRHPDELARLVPSSRPGIYPSGFWLRRTEA